MPGEAGGSGKDLEGRPKMRRAVLLLTLGLAGCGSPVLKMFGMISGDGILRGHVVRRFDGIGS